MIDQNENDVGYLIQQIEHLLGLLFNKKLAKEGLSFSHARVIYLLYANDGMTQSELQQDLLIKASSITKLIDILVEKGLVKREGCSSDARIKRIYLTEAGRQKERILCQIKEQTEADLLRSLSTNEQQTFVRLLKQVKATLV